MILPWQKFFLDSSPDLNHYNQSRLFVTKPNFNDSLLEEVLLYLINRHASLRCQFNKNAEGWTQSFHAYDQIKCSNLISRYDLEDFEESEQDECITFCCNQAQESLNIFQAELIKIVYFKNTQEGRLFITIHELAIDQFSWTILLKDFEYIYNHLQHGLAIDSETDTTILPGLFSQLNEYANSELLADQKQYWINTLKNQWIGSIPVDHPNFSQNTVNHTQTYTVRWSKETSVLLLEKCIKIFHTESIIILLTALVKTIEKITDASSARISLEKRIAGSFIENTADLTKTLGDLTYTFPLTVSLPYRSNFQTSINLIKKQLRDVPEKGLSFDVLKYLKKDPEIIALTSNHESWIHFNFQEHSENTVLTDSACLNGIAKEDKGSERGSNILRKYVLAFNGGVIDDQIQFTIDYNELQYEIESIERIADTFKLMVEEIVSYSMQSHIGGYIPSDFPSATLSDFEIDELSFNYKNIEDIYPVSYSQKNIIHHCCSRLNTNTNQVILRIEGKANLDKLKHIGSDIINHHPILRSFFYGDFNNLHQVIVRSISYNWHYIEWNGQDNQREKYLSEYCNSIRNKAIYADGPLMDFHIVQFFDHYNLIWNIHPALLDKQSILLFAGLLKHMIQSEAGNALDLEKTFRSDRFLFDPEAMDLADEFWDQKLNETTEAVLFENIIDSHPESQKYESYSITIEKELQGKLLGLSTNSRISLESIVLAAYAIALQAYTTHKTVCIGLVSSGLPTTQEVPTVGFYENVIPISIETSMTNLSFVDFSKKIYDDNMQLKKHRYIPRFDNNYKSPFETTLRFDDSIPSKNHTDSNIHYVYETGYILNLISNITDTNSFTFNYKTSVFERSEVMDFSKYFTSILYSFSSTPDAYIHSIPKYKKTNNTKHTSFITKPTSEERAIRQTKIRGFKIDFNRIEAAINKTNAVKEALVILRDNKLVAYIGSDEETEHSNEIPHSLASSLPSYMIPETFFWVKSLSELDTLPDLKHSLSSNAPLETNTVASPINSIEETTLKVCKEILNNDSINLSDNFFQLGGNSLKGIQVFSQIKAMGFPISILDIFESKTIGDIAKKITLNPKSIKIKQNENIKGLGRLLPFHLYYFYHYKDTAWNISRKTFFNERLKEELMSLVLIHLFQHHDALRINFIDYSSSSEFQIQNIKMVNLAIEEIQPDFITYHWMSHTNDQFLDMVNNDIACIEANNLYKKKNLSAFRIYKGPEKDYFYMMVSHLICDAISLQIMYDDITNWYNQLNSGQAITKEDKTDSYILATKKTHEYVNSPQFLEEIPFWKNTYAAFQNNQLIPRDYTINNAQEKQIISFKKILLQKDQLKKIEARCLLNKTNIHDLVLAAYGHIINEWCGIKSFGTLFISSGRNFTYADIDVSKTVGCFAGATHLKIETFEDGLDMLNKSILLTQYRNQIPNRGAASNLLLNLDYYRQLDPNSEFVKDINSLIPEDGSSIQFNYFDQRKFFYDSIDPENDLTQEVDEAFEEVDSPQSAFFTLNLYHGDRALLLEWVYNGAEYKKDTIAGLTTSLENILSNIA